MAKNVPWVIVSDTNAKYDVAGSILGSSGPCQICPVLHLGYNGLQVARKQVQGGSSTYVEVGVEVRNVFGSWAGEDVE